MYQNRFILIYFLTSIILFGYFTLFGIQTSPDTESYIIAFDTLCSRHLDFWRTPIYPLIIGPLNKIFSYEGMMIPIVILQGITFLISIYYFDIVSLEICKSKRLSFLTTLLYIAFPYTGRYVFYIITESFSISFIVFWIYICYQIWDKGLSWKRVSWFALWLSFIIMLRPASVAFLFPALVFILFVIKSNKKFLWKSMTSILIPIILICLYVLGIRLNYGVTTISGIGALNHYLMAVQQDYISGEGVENKDLSLEFDKLHYIREIPDPTIKVQKAYPIIDQLYKEYGYNDVTIAINQMYKTNLTSVLKKSVNRFYNFIIGNESSELSINTWLNFTLKVLKISFLFSLLLLLGFTFYMTQPPIIFMNLSIWTLLLLVIFNSHDEYFRLLAAIFPFYIILIGYVITSFVNFFKASKTSFSINNL